MPVVLTPKEAERLLGERVSGGTATGVTRTRRPPVGWGSRCVDCEEIVVGEAGQKHHTDEHRHLRYESFDLRQPGRGAPSGGAGEPAGAGVHGEGPTV